MLSWLPDAPGLCVTWAVWEPPINQWVTHQDQNIVTKYSMRLWWLVSSACGSGVTALPHSLKIMILSQLSTVSSTQQTECTCLLAHVTACHPSSGSRNAESRHVGMEPSSSVVTGDALDAAVLKCKCKLILWDDRLAGCQDGSQPQLLFHSKLVSIIYLPQQHSLDMTHHPSIQCMGILLIQNTWSSTQSLHDIFVNQNDAYSVF